ncbi:hypothetical protein ACFL0J_07595 [Candidatus Neomarinimicrobiota bacterium]
MNKIYLPFLIITYVLILAGIGIFKVGTIDSYSDNTLLEYFFVAMISILFIAGIILSIKRYKSEKQGLSIHDEMSAKIVNKSASYSFYLSLVMWIVIIFYQSKVNLDGSILIGYGMIGMATIFIIFLTYFNFKGVKN